MDGVVNGVNRYARELHCGFPFTFLLWVSEFYYSKSKM